jgi:hypothetical protein
MIGIIVYLLGVAVQYVRVNTVHRKWKDEYNLKCKRECDADFLTPMAVIGSWASFVFMESKRILDNLFINKTK